MHKIIKNLPEITLCDLAGNPLLDRTGQPIRKTMTDFLVDLMVDPVFLGTRTGLAAAEFIENARAAVVPGELSPDGFRVSFDQHHAFLSVVQKPARPFNQAALLSLLPFMRAVADAKEAAPMPQAAE